VPFYETMWTNMVQPDGQQMTTSSTTLKGCKLHAR